MILALILLVVGVLIITPLLSYMGSGLKVGQVYEKNMDEFYAADSGIEFGMWKLLNDETAPPPGYELNNADVVVTIIGPVTYNEAKWQTFSLSEDDTVYQIISEAGSTTLDSYVATTIGGEISSDPDEYDYYYPDGNVETEEGETIDGSVYAENGNVILEAGVTIEGDVYAKNGNVYIYEGATINGNVYSDNNDVQLLGAGATINGNVIAKGNVQLEEDTVINGFACSEEGNVQLMGAGATIYGNAYAKGDVDLVEDTLIEGNAYADGNVTLDGGEITGIIYLYFEGCPPCGSAGIEIITIAVN